MNPMILRLFVEAHRRAYENNMAALTKLVTAKRGRLVVLSLDQVAVPASR